jgi:hypothetical protein
VRERALDHERHLGAHLDGRIDGRIAAAVKPPDGR